MEQNRYEQYVKSCHSDNAGNLSSQNLIEILDVPTSYPLWTSKGVAGSFMWRSLTTLFAPDIHFIDSKKRNNNQFFLQMTSQSGLHMMSHLVHSMENDFDYNHLIKDGDTLVANSDELFLEGQDFERDRALGMREYLRQNITLNDADCFTMHEQTIHFLHDNVRNVNIIVPMPVLMNSRLQMFVQIADALCKIGAKAVYGVFLTYLVPSSDGRDYGKYPAIPEIRGLSFSEMMDLF